MKFNYNSTSIFINSNKDETYDDCFNIDIDHIIISIRLVKPSDDYNIIRISVLLIKNKKYSYKISFDEIFEDSSANKLLSKKSAIRLIKKQLSRDYVNIIVGKSICLLDVRKNITYYEFDL